MLVRHGELKARVRPPRFFEQDFDSFSDEVSKRQLRDELRAAVEYTARLPIDPGLKA